MNPSTDPSGPPRIAAEDPLFRTVIAVASGLALGGMLASLAVFERGSHGRLAFHWHWASIPLSFVGLALGIQFWRTLWKAQMEDTDAARRKLRHFVTFLGIMAVCSFAYPLRFVQPGRRGEVLMGLGLAVVVLSGFGFLIWKTIQWVNENEPKDDETHPPDDNP